MDAQNMIFFWFIVLAVALSIYGMVTGRWLLKKALKLADEAKAGGYKAFKSLAMLPITIIALILFPIWVLEFFGGMQQMAIDRWDIVGGITLVPSLIYYGYLRFKAEKK